VIVGTPRIRLEGRASVKEESEILGVNICRKVNTNLRVPGLIGIMADRRIALLEIARVVKVIS
jgi:hypothetical protein